MNILSVIPESIVDGKGIRTSIYVSGCTHNCKGCHNPESHNFKNGKLLDEKYALEIVNNIKKNNIIDGITLSGGDPLHINNLPGVKYLLELLELKLKKHMNTWIYTGYTIEELLKRKYEGVEKYTFDILSMTDVLVDSKFVLEKRDTSLKFRGSSNQRVIDINKTLSSWDKMKEKEFNKKLTNNKLKVVEVDL